MTNKEYHNALEKGFTIAIPSWNNDNYLNMCIEYIKKHSKYDHEILVFLNGCEDDSKQVCEKHGVAYMDSPENLGICVGLNALAEHASRAAFVYFNDDMLAMPDWDTNIVKFFKEYDIPELSFITATMVEPKGVEQHITVSGPLINHGETWDTFDSDRFLKDLPAIKKMRPHQIGACWVPNVLSTRIYKELGGMDEEYSPGRGSDPDIAATFYEAGCRHFVSLGDSLVYHFGMISTPRMDTIKRTNPGQIFWNKWRNASWTGKYGQLHSEQFLHQVLKRDKSAPNPFYGSPIA